MPLVLHLHTELKRLKYAEKRYVSNVITRLHN